MSNKLVKKENKNQNNYKNLKKKRINNINKNKALINKGRLQQQNKIY